MKDKKEIVNLIFNVIGVAMGVAVTTLNILNQIDAKESISLLGIGLFSISLATLNKK